MSYTLRIPARLASVEYANSLADSLQASGLETLADAVRNADKPSGSYSPLLVEFAEDSEFDVDSVFDFFEGNGSWADCSIETGYNGITRTIARCVYSGETDFVDQMRCDPDGDYVTQDVFDDHYFDCDGCGRTLCNDYRYSTDYGSSYCESCYEENEETMGIQYFDGPRKNFDKANSFGSSRSFGVELETQYGRVDECYAFSGKSDGSINGTEFVSRKLRGDAGLKELKDFMASGRDIEVDDHCGCHVHINCSDLNDDELYAVTAAYVATEDWWHSQVDADRDGGTYCHRWSDYTRSDFFAYIRMGHSFESWSNNFDRYHWLNCASYTEHSTLENRLHHGTWNYAELKKWIITNLRFVRAARYLRLPADCNDRAAMAEFNSRAKLALQWAASGSMESPYTAGSAALVECA